MRQPFPSNPAATDENPYVGLTHFTEVHADRFFGRDPECALIIGNLRAARLTLLYAESGVGKSSALRAGVVARLRGYADRDLEARGSPRLVPVVFSAWSERPVAGLIRAIDDAVRPYLADGVVLELPEDDLEQAIAAASEAIDATLLIILDQFEEYFLYPEDQVEQKRVAAQLARCVNRADLRANFLISIREDSYARLGDLFRGKIRNVYANFLQLDFLNRNGAREAIEKPLDGESVEVESALVDAVLDQVGRTPITSTENGAEAKARDEVETTYLQLVMRRLWEVEAESGSRELRLRTLEDLGGAQAIISGHLDRAMEDGADGDGGLTDAQRQVAASIFKFLVTTEGTKIALTARDISDYSKRPASEIEPVLQHLSSPRLHILRPVAAEDGQGKPRFEIFHDALARPIVEWRTGVEEEELEERVNKERAEKERAQRAAAEAERREAGERKRKRFALGLFGIALVALVAGAIYFAIDQGELADQRDAANQSARVSQRISELAYAPSVGPVPAALASLEAYDLSPTFEARNQALAQLQLNPGMPKVVAGHTRGVTTVAYWPDSDRIASGGYDGSVRLWNAQGEELGSPMVAPGHEVMSVAVSEPSGTGTRIVAAGLESGFVRLWKIDDSGDVLAREKLHVARGADLLGLAFNPAAPTTLAVGATDGRLTLWRMTDQGEGRKLDARRARGEIYDLAFDRSGRRLLVASYAGGQEWKVSVAGFKGSGSVTIEPEPRESVAVAPNGSVAFGGRGGIKLFDAQNRRFLRLHPLGQTLSLAFARGGSVLVSAGSDWNITTWDVATGRPFGPPRFADQAEVNDVAVRSDGEEIASAGLDTLLKLWPLEPAHPLAATLGGFSPTELDLRLHYVSNLSVGTDARVAAASEAAGTSIWKLRSTEEMGSVARPLLQIPGYSSAVALYGDILAIGTYNSLVLDDVGESCRTMPTKPCRLGAAAGEPEVYDLAMSKQGHRLLLATAGYYDVTLWDVTDVAKNGEVVPLFTRRLDSPVNHLALSSTSRLIAVAAEDGKLQVWDIRDPREPKALDTRGGPDEGQPIHAVAFSPDGALLASGGVDQQVTLWKVERRDAGLPRLSATPSTLFQTQTILSLAFSPDGEYLAAGDGDGSTCVYEVENRVSIGNGSCLLGHATASVGYGGIEAATFARLPGGETTLLTGGTAQPIVSWSSLLWNLSDDDRVERAIARGVCEFAGRNLTTFEWGAIFDSTELADDRRETCPQYPLP